MILLLVAQLTQNRQFSIINVIFCIVNEMLKFCIQKSLTLAFEIIAVASDQTFYLSPNR
jgi:hypothetical protein